MLFFADNENAIAQKRNTPKKVDSDRQNHSDAWFDR